MLSREDSVDWYGFLNLKVAWIGLLALSSLELSGCTLQSSSASNQVTARQSGTIKQTVDSLRQLKTDGPDDGIPSAAKPLLTTLKHQLRDAIDLRINSINDQASPGDLRGGVLSDLKDLDITVEDPEPADEENVFNDLETGYTYGNIYDITLENPADRSDLLVATTTVGVCCGSDTSLYIFQNDGSRWNLTMAVEASDYDDVSGAQGRFQYRLSPSDPQGNFFLVAANVNPWCTSNWQSLRFKVLRPGQTAYEPRVLLSEKRTIYLGNGFEDEQGYRLRLRGNRFSLEFYGEKYEKSMAGDDETDGSALLDVASYRVLEDQVLVLRKPVADIANVAGDAR